MTSAGLVAHTPETWCRIAGCSRGVAEGLDASLITLRRGLRSAASSSSIAVGNLRS